MANLPVGTSLATPSDTVAGLYIDQADETGLAIQAHGAGAASTAAGIFQVGCLYINTGSTGEVLYQMTGTTASPAWTQLETGSAGTPGGSTGQVQYNNAGAFGGANVSYSSTGAGNTTFTTANTFAIVATAGNFTVTHAGGNVFLNLPIANPNIAGALWANSGIVTVSAG